MVYALLSTEVPPHIHNAALSQLDASLINPSMKTPEVSTSLNQHNLFVSPSSTLLGKAGPTSMAQTGIQTSSEAISPGAFGFTFTPPINANTHLSSGSGISQNARGAQAGSGAKELLEKPSPDAIERLEKELNGMDLSPGFIYLDEVGMTFVHLFPFLL